MLLTGLSYRHEFKYLISYNQLVVLQNRICSLLSKDKNVGENGVYNIRSLYFDDINNKCFYENENGVDPREKWRIRIYNCSDMSIKLECKRKENGKTFKRSCRIDRFIVDEIINNYTTVYQCDTPPPHSHRLMRYSQKTQLYNKFLLEKEIFGYMPSVIVDYQRIPYIYELGNVRVTFDTNISSSSDVCHFFNQNIELRPVLPVGYHLMEVKYDDFLPDFIHQALELENLSQTTFSKYYICRKYSLK